ncbi:16S rRNA (guanine527-N7)-methyltransferase [Pullulanibacillus pueri]|uniref:Ribosomal RNA small subunit methyltransferase G n=1 Tax=Pullulanibacillus pueri TaxID=1437324 RepID=A0A8J3ELB6_9BACL|nr:16S rRNA (guanine(527)-N(7))-methyltransferase RsmG [Pullulanibacillus pueri]MBM7682173.1 16S rRNA (guanine527-N7)-methyltransferase [Pullulanibacillus pueri]GGH80318.1 ribosomal RNA small subunit methyltransferase G [Pullulanibacillus pueri]
MEGFNNLLKEKGIVLSPFQVNQFNTYYETLIEWNSKINLTAITEKSDVYLKHFYDSLTPSFFFDFSQPLSLCDVGAGAGFPSIPLKIIYPELEVTIVDALNKRIGFLEELTNRLELSGVHLYHDRAETFGHRKNIRESFDIVTARAVARLNILSEYCMPLTKVGGTFIAMKGASGKDEIDESQIAIQKLGGELQRVEPFLLPEEQSHRDVIMIQKVRTTPKKYPRKPGTPSKQPL